VIVWHLPEKLLIRRLTKMGLPKTYFQSEPGSPSPLSATGKRRIRFEEVDMFNIAWHGHYMSYLDEGRIAFGDKYGLSYSAMKEAVVAAPIVQIHLDYITPLRFDQEVAVEAILYWTNSLKLNFEYKLTAEGRLVARAYSVQLFVDLDGQTLFIPSGFISEFRQKWKNGEF
jgi:acyl-CoA thioester hydrolase